MNRAWPRSTSPRFGPRETGAYTAQVMKLSGKPNIDLAFPVIKLWIDQGDQEHPQAPGIRAFWAAAAHVRTIRAGEDLLRIEEVDVWYPERCASRRGGEGQLDLIWSSPWTCAPWNPIFSPRPGWRARADDPGGSSGRCWSRWSGWPAPCRRRTGLSENDMFAAPASDRLPVPVPATVPATATATTTTTTSVVIPATS